MSGRSLAACFAVMAVVLLGTVEVTGQSLRATDGWSSPRTPWGDPDLQGIWTNTTTTPLERPDDIQAGRVLTEEERSALDAERDRTREQRREGETGSYNNYWLERGTLSARPSLIVEPSDGRLPMLTAKGKAVRTAAADARARIAAGPEDRNLYERCLSRAMPGSMMPGFYNHNYQIFQTPDYVVILVEMIHDARIIPLDGRAHTDSRITQWLGDSRGHWEGDTLVVETTNLIDVSGRGRTVFGGSGTTRLVERFTRVDDDTIDYQFTLTDPTEYAAPWTASLPMAHLGGPLFEYACHEGNYGLENILAGARADEQSVALATSSK